MLALRIDQHPDETGAGAAIAARRKVRRVQAELDDALSLVDSTGGVVLVPGSDWGALDDLVGRMTRAAGTGRRPLNRKLTARMPASAVRGTLAALNAGWVPLTVVQLTRAATAAP